MSDLPDQEIPPCNPIRGLDPNTKPTKRQIYYRNRWDASKSLKTCECGKQLYVITALHLTSDLHNRRMRELEMQREIERLKAIAEQPKKEDAPIVLSRRR